MGNVIITYNEVYDLNQILELKGIHFKVHLHDTCGRQSFTIEAIENNTPEKQYKVLLRETTKYFNSRDIKVSFFDNRSGFILN